MEFCSETFARGAEKHPVSPPGRDFGDLMRSLAALSADSVQICADKRKGQESRPQGRGYSARAATESAEVIARKGRHCLNYSGERGGVAARQICFDRRT